MHDQILPNSKYRNIRGKYMHKQKDLQKKAQEF